MWDSWCKMAVRQWETVCLCPHLLWNWKNEFKSLVSFHVICLLIYDYSTSWNLNMTAWTRVDTGWCWNKICLPILIPLTAPDIYVSPHQCPFCSTRLAHGSVIQLLLPSTSSSSFRFLPLITSLIFSACKSPPSLSSAVQWEHNSSRSIKLCNCIDPRWKEDQYLV